MNLIVLNRISLRTIGISARNHMRSWMMSRMRSSCNFCDNLTLGCWPCWVWMVGMSWLVVVTCGRERVGPWLHMPRPKALHQASNRQCRAANRPVRLLIDNQAVEQDLRATPVQCNAKWTLSSLFALHSSHLHFISTHLIRALLISFHVFSYVSYSQVLLDSFHFIWAQLNVSHLTEANLNPSRLFCTSESLRHRCTYSEESLQNALYYKVCTKHFVRQSLHRVHPSSTLYYKTWRIHLENKSDPLCKTTTEILRNNF